MRKNAQLVLKLPMTTTPTINMEIFLEDRKLKSPRWFFLLFAPFSIKGHLLVFANEEQLERNGLQSLEIDDDNSPKHIYRNILFLKLIFAYLRGCHIFGSWFNMFSGRF